LIPHIDFISASKWVLGKHWRRADKQQKLRFIREFRTLLVRFYSSALADFLKTNQVQKDMIRFLPYRGESSDDVTIRSEVHAPDGKTIPVNYYLHQTRKGWKVYDVSVEGISMITTYRTSFANEIKLKGVDGLIESLAEKNRATNS
jgi:phospholipid transport system substrate-binding protein